MDAGLCMPGRRNLSSIHLVGVFLGFFFWQDVEVHLHRGFFFAGCGGSFTWRFLQDVEVHLHGGFFLPPKKQKHAHPGPPQLPRACASFLTGFQFLAFSKKLNFKFRIPTRSSLHKLIPLPTNFRNLKPYTLIQDSTCSIH
jgi:hypothetical protein